jgi:hypothetical protein
VLVAVSNFRVRLANATVDMRGVPKARSRFFFSVSGPYGDKYEYFLVVSRLDFSSTLKTEAILSSKASSVNFYWTTRRHILQYSVLLVLSFMSVLAMRTLREYLTWP